MLMDLSFSNLFTGLILLGKCDGKLCLQFVIPTMARKLNC